MYVKLDKKTGKYHGEDSLTFYLSCASVFEASNPGSIIPCGTLYLKVEKVIGKVSILCDCSTAQPFIKINFNGEYCANDGSSTTELQKARVYQRTEFSYESGRNSILLPVAIGYTWELV